MQDLIISNELIATIIGSLIAATVSYNLFKRTKKDTYIKERYEQVIFPIFVLIEPYLYSKTIDEKVISVVSEICDIVFLKRMYIGGYLLEQIDLCKKEINSPSGLSKTQFTYLCSRISIEYDKCCKELGVKKRSFAYKMSNSQLHPNKVTALNEFVKYSTLALTIIFIIILASAVINFIYLILKLIGV